MTSVVVTVSVNSFTPPPRLLSFQKIFPASMPSFACDCRHRPADLLYAHPWPRRQVARTPHARTQPTDTAHKKRKKIYISIKFVRTAAVPFIIAAGISQRNLILTGRALLGHPGLSSHLLTPRPWVKGHGCLNPILNFTLTRKGTTPAVARPNKATGSFLHGENNNTNGQLRRLVTVRTTRLPDKDGSRVIANPQGETYKSGRGM